MSKPYTFNEIELFLTKRLSKSKHILTFGYIGSKNVEHDIDVIITKKTLSSTSEFYMEVHTIFGTLDNFLDNAYGAHVLTFPGGRGAELSNFSIKSDKDLLFEVMIYTSYSQIVKDWDWALFENESLENILKSQTFIHGSFADLLSNNFKKSSYYDPMYIRLYLSDRIFSKYPEAKLITITSLINDYLYRKRLGKKAPIIKNLADVKNAFYKLCDIIDKLDKNRV